MARKVQICGLGARRGEDECQMWRVLGVVHVVVCCFEMEPTNHRGGWLDQRCLDPGMGYDSESGPLLLRILRDGQTRVKFFILLAITVVYLRVIDCLAETNIESLSFSARKNVTAVRQEVTNHVARID